jgi:hypothetical protein
MAVSFRTFCDQLGFEGSVDASRILAFVGLSRPISLLTLMSKVGAPVAPITSAQGIGIDANPQVGDNVATFTWEDPSAIGPNAPSQSVPATTVIRRASSFLFTLFPPQGNATTATLPPPSGGALAPVYNATVGSGRYSWLVTSINNYGRTSSPLSFFGASGPTISIDVDGEQENAVVHGSGFSSNMCKVVVPSEGFIQAQTVTGDITKGVHITISCENMGQYWDVQVTAVSGGPTVYGRIYCAGGGF